MSGIQSGDILIFPLMQIDNFYSIRPIPLISYSFRLIFPIMNFPCKEYV